MTLPTTKQIQRALIEEGFLDVLGPDNKPNDDGDFGKITRSAIRNYEAAHGLPVIGSQWSPSFLNSLFPPAPPPASTSIFSQIGNVISIINLVKGIQMDTANVDVKSAWLSSKNWAAGIAILTNIAAVFHIAIPADLAPDVIAVVDSVTALYILVKNTWFTTTVTTASAKKLS